MKLRKAGNRFWLRIPIALVVSGDQLPTGYTCGPQKPALAVRMQFSPLEAGTKADGLARALHFGEE
ncbi:MAG: hypothetical protein WDO18_05595 [Acidobacteriota bacterium]